MFASAPKFGLLKSSNEATWKPTGKNSFPSHLKFDFGMQALTWMQAQTPTHRPFYNLGGAHLAPKFHKNRLSDSVYSLVFVVAARVYN